MLYFDDVSRDTSTFVRLFPYSLFVFIKINIRTNKLQVQFSNYLQIHFYMVLIITEVLFETCFSDVQPAHIQILLTTHYCILLF